MGKSLLIVITILIILFGAACGFVISERNKKKEIILSNKYYENYLNKEIYGTELATIIGKATEQNLRNKIEKDKNGTFYENDTNSLKIYKKMYTINKTIPMEAIYENGISMFVENFNTSSFKCTSIEYHKKTGLISTINFEEK